MSVSIEMTFEYLFIHNVRGNMEGLASRSPSSYSDPRPFGLGLTKQWALDPI
jgi:hypothetical protein